MRILALDIATRSGWAAGEGADNAPAFGTLVLPASVTPGDYGRRFAAFRRGMVRLIAEHSPRCIWFEAPLTFGGDTNQHTMRMLIGLAAICEEVAETYEIECVEANNQAIRKHFIGTARGNREELKAGVMRRCHEMGWDVCDDNQGDACALFDYARHRLRIAGRLTQSLPLMGVVS